MRKGLVPGAVFQLGLIKSHSPWSQKRWLPGVANGISGEWETKPGPASIPFPHNWKTIAGAFSHVPAVPWKGFWLLRWLKCFKFLSWKKIRWISRGFPIPSSSLMSSEITVQSALLISAVFRFLWPGKVTCPNVSGLSVLTSFLPFSLVVNSFIHVTIFSWRLALCDALLGTVGDTEMNVMYLGLSFAYTVQEDIGLRINDFADT